MSLVDIKAAFPGLQPGFSITSPITRGYNCIGWAANDPNRSLWWWPGMKGYWPIPHNNVASIATFEAAFATLGYVHTGLDDQLVPGVEKVAIYTDTAGLVTHMARQLSKGTWTSKLGEAWDIEHMSVGCLNGTTYGRYSHCLGR